MLNSTRGSAKETELNQLMVVPRNWPSVPCNALGMSVVFNCPLDSLLVHHVPFSVVGIVSHRRPHRFRSRLGGDDFRMVH